MEKGNLRVYNFHYGKVPIFYWIGLNTYIKCIPKPQDVLAVIAKECGNSYE